MFTTDNTAGYSISEIVALNIELAKLLKDVEIYSEEYYRIEKEFKDKVSKR